MQNFNNRHTPIKLKNFILPVLVELSYVRVSMAHPAGVEDEIEKITLWAKQHQKSKSRYKIEA